MEQHHRKALQSHRVSLAQEMVPKLVYPYLIENNIYEPYMVEDFEVKGSRFDQNNALLSSLVTRGPHAFDTFVDALIETGQNHLAEKLRPSGPLREPRLPSSTPIAHPTDQTLPSSNHHQQPSQPQIWPNPQSSGDLSQAKLAGGDSARMDTDASEVYSMSGKPRGVAFILNNKVFTNGMKTREGSDVDMRNLRHVFTELHFEVVVRDNLSGREIKNVLKDIASNMVKKKHDCLVLALLSHGVDGSIYGRDGELVKIHEVTARFDGEHCQQLIGKPKLFFIQACRGENMDRGIDAMDASGIPSKQVKVEEGAEAVEHPLSPEEEQSLVESMLKVEIESTDAYASRQMLPSNSDTLLAYATVPGFVSWRNSERGSWFIQAITEVFLEKSHREDLLSMMTMVNNRVAIAFQSTSGSYKQMPAPVTMLTKKLYFNPGYFEK